MQGDDSNTSPDANWQFKPGDTITPGQSAPSVPPPEPEAPPAPAPTPTEPPAVAANPTPASPPPTVGNQPAPAPAGAIRWTASEFIAHNKSAGWYFMLGLAAVVIAGGIWLFTKDKISSGVILVAAIALGAYGARKPRQLEYELDSQGLRIGQKYYTYEEFRSFAVIPEGAFSSVVFMPLRRFAPLTTIYYEPADEERIINLLADRLPMEDRQHDAVDRFMRRIRY